MRLSGEKRRGGAHGRTHPWRSAKGVFALSALVIGAFAMVPAAATHGSSSLGSSKFEIDDDANLAVDHAPSIDWASVPDDRQEDILISEDDDSFGQGSKEDTPVPAVVDGSIPPNKSDLLHFGVYFEENTDFMHVFWHRVQEPSGTTNMDFELNQSEVTSGNGVTPVRTAGDMLIQYDLSQGGTHPQLFLSKWVATGPGSQCQASNKTPCWGTKVNLTEAGDAIGSINTAAIPAAQADGLGDISPRTFGEATIDLTGLLPPGSVCNTFASAYLKSRSSDSFSSSLKDFIAPIGVGGDSCGDLKIVKNNNSNQPLAGAKFKVYADDGDQVPQLGTLDAQIGDECTTTDDGTGDCTFFDIPIGTKVWVKETQAPTGYLPIDDPVLQEISDNLLFTVTFTNTPALGSLEVTKVDDGQNLMNNIKFTLVGTSTLGNSVNLNCVTGVSNSSGGATPATGKCSFLNVEIGTYTLDEDATTLPSGYLKDPTFPKQVTITSGGLETKVATNPRAHRVVVLVCHEGTNSLLSTNVLNNASNKSSISGVPAHLAAKNVTPEDLCNIGGASFGGLGHGDSTSTASIANH